MRIIRSALNQFDDPKGDSEWYAATTVAFEAFHTVLEFDGKYYFTDGYPYAFPAESKEAALQILLDEYGKYSLVEGEAVYVKPIDGEASLKVGDMISQGNVIDTVSASTSVARKPLKISRGSAIEAEQDLRVPGDGRQNEGEQGYVLRGRKTFSPSIPKEDTHEDIEGYSNLQVPNESDAGSEFENSDDYAQIDKAYMEDVCEYIEEQMLDETYKARCNLVKGFAGIPSIEVTVFDGRPDSENGAPLKVFTISEDNLRGVGVEDDAQAQTDRMVSELDKLYAASDASSDPVLAAELGTDDDYINDLANRTLDRLTDKGYQGGYQIQPDGNYLYFELFDETDEVMSTYLQPLEDITVVWDDLEDDADTLSDAIISSLSSQESDVESSTDIEADAWDDFVADCDKYNAEHNVDRKEWEYKGLTVDQYYEAGESGPDSDIFEFNIYSEGTPVVIDELTNDPNFDMYDNEAIKSYIDKITVEGYELNPIDDSGYDDGYSSSKDYGPSNPWDAPGMSVRDFI